MSASESETGKPALRSFVEICAICGGDDRWSESFYRNLSAGVGEIYWHSTHARECREARAVGAGAAGSGAGGGDGGL